MNCESLPPPLLKGLPPPLLNTQSLFVLTVTEIWLPPPPDVNSLPPPLLNTQSLFVLTVTEIWLPPPPDVNSLPPPLLNTQKSFRADGYRDLVVYKSMETRLDNTRRCRTKSWTTISKQKTHI
ncbi:hypothetical protein GEMRC1_008303 [Eukaryota sp. GEM-RC1]